MDRGKIRNREQARQIVSYDGLKWGTITPTDIDGCIEYRDRAFIFFESKYKGAELETGQRLAFERLIDNLSKMKPAILIFVWHENEPNTDIKIASCQVVRFYYQQKWREEKSRRKLKEFCDRFIEHIQLSEETNDCPY